MVARRRLHLWLCCFHTQEYFCPCTGAGTYASLPRVLQPVLYIKTPVGAARQPPGPVARLYLPHHEFACQQGRTDAFREGVGGGLKFKKDHLTVKDTIRLFIIFSFCLTILLSCSKQSDVKTSDLEKQFSTIVPLDNMNKSLEIAVARDVADNEQSFQ